MGSVAIKKAPKRNPPPSRAGRALGTGFIARRKSIWLSAAYVIVSDRMIVRLAVLVQYRYIPPNRVQMTEVTPTVPLTFPKNNA